MSSKSTTFTPEQKKAYGIAMAKMRKQAYYTGRGDYRKTNYYPKKRTYTRKNYVKKASNSESIGSKIGSFLGNAAQNIISKLVGFGDYTVVSNSMLPNGSTLSDPPPVMNTVSADNAVIVRHREYIGDIMATTEFTNTSYSINPGLFNVFPWLSQIALSFNEYEFRGLVFEFKSTSSDAVLSSANSNALGTVMMATNYNSSDDDYASKAEMLNSEFSNSSKPSVSFMHPVECARKQNVLSNMYVRGGDLDTDSNQDIKMYDLGKFQIATYGFQADTGIAGELWATYEIAFYKTKYVSQDARGNTVLTDHYVLDSYTNSAPLGNSGAVVDPVSGSSIGTYISSDGTTLHFPNDVNEGEFLIAITWQGVAAPLTIGTVARTGASGISLLPGNASVYASPTTSVTSARCMILITARINQSNASVVLSGFTLPSSGDTLNIFVTQINNNLSE